MGLRKLLVAGIAGLVLSTAQDMPMTYVEKLSQEQVIAKKILENTKVNQVVMFGEVHQDYRKDNDFVIGLLSELKKRGFGYLALEFPRDVSKVPEGEEYLRTFSDYINGRISKFEIPPKDYFEIYRHAAGWIELVEEAKRLGIRIVTYDDIVRELDDIVRLPNLNNSRENNAFKNIYELIFKDNPDAKVIVYCGAFHVSEQPNMFSGEEITWLGSYLETYTLNKSFSVSFADNVGVHIPFCDLNVVFED